MICNALVIDSADDIRLLKESISDLSIPINLNYTSSMAKAVETICNNPPDLILIGSGLLLKEGFEFLSIARKIPTILLCESEGFNILFKKSFCNALLVTRPFDLDEIPELFNKVLEFWTIQKEKS